MERTSSGYGKAKRLGRIFDAKSGRAVVVPLDDLLISGPPAGRSPHALVAAVMRGGADALLGYPGLFRQTLDARNPVSMIVNVTASTVRSAHTRKSGIFAVSTAVRLGADAVAAHINLGSRYEPEMLRLLGSISEQCEDAGMPLMAIAYPRSDDGAGDAAAARSAETDAELVAHAARVAVELGADIVKTQFPGDPQSFRRVVDACAPTPVLVAGGPKTDAVRALAVASSVVAAGGAGVSFGRNVFLRESPSRMVHALRLVVHDLVPPHEALACASRNETTP